MRYGILCGVAVAALAWACAGAAQPAVRGETWTRVAADDEGEYYYDPASVERAGGMVRSRLRAVVRAGQPGPMRSMIVRVEINCVQQTMAYLAFDAYGEGDRLLVSGPNDRHQVEGIRSGSPEEVLYRRLCPPALVRRIMPPLPPPMTVAPPPGPPMMRVPPPMRHPAPLAPPPPPPPPPPRSRIVPARPLVPLASIVSTNDYPRAALRAEAQGRVGVRLRISRRGRVSACTVTASSGHPLLDARTCRIFTERARFVPARNDRGRTVGDMVNAGVVWRIPSD